MNSAPRQVRLAEGGGVLGRRDALALVTGILRSYFDLEAADATHQPVMKFTHYRRSDQSIGEYILEFDLLRRKAE